MKKEKQKIVVFFSGGASSLRYLIENDKNYKKEYEIVVAFTNDKNSSGVKFCDDNNIPCLMLGFKHFQRTSGELCMYIENKEEKIREKYFEEVTKMISSFNPDFIILSGFMLRITKPLLGFVPIINVHPADLRIKKSLGGKPKYTGDDAVTDAIQAGETSTASTIHLVEEEVDCGKIICVSDRISVLPGVNPKDHQEKMKSLCDGPAYVKALELITKGEFVFYRNKTKSPLAN